MKKFLFSIFIAGLIGCSTAISTPPQTQSKPSAVSITVNNGIYDDLDGMSQIPKFYAQELFADSLKKFIAVDINNANAEYKLIISYKEESFDENAVADFGSGVLSFVTLGFFPTTIDFVTNIHVLKKAQLLKTYTYRSNISSSNVLGGNKHRYFHTIQPICDKLISDLVKDKILIGS